MKPAYPSTQFFSFSSSFHENISNNSLALPLGSAPPLRNPGSATECILMIEHGLKAYLENSEVLSAESVPALRFEPGTSDSKAKTIPLHKRV